MKMLVTHNDREFYITKEYFTICNRLKDLPDFNNMVIQHVERTNKHIDRVLKYFKRLKYSPMIPPIDHDSDKLNTSSIIYIPYVLNTQRCLNQIIDNEFTDDELYILKEACWLHIKSNEHHPEYWDDYALKTNVQNECQIIDASMMQDAAIIEMVCDWCAMSEEMHNDPYEWFNKTSSKRWLFTDSQIRYIIQLMDLIWTMN